MLTSRAAPVLYAAGLFATAVFAPIPGLSVVANGVVALLLGVYLGFMRERLDRVTLALCLLLLPHLLWVGVSYFWSVDRDLAYVAFVATVTSILTCVTALLLSRCLPRSRVVHLSLLLALVTHMAFAARQYLETPYLRLSGITENANLLAFILLCLWFLYALLDDVHPAWRQWWVPLLIFVTTLPVVLATASKKAIPGFLMVAVALGWRHRRSKRQVAVVVGTLVGAALLAATLSSVNVQSQLEDLQKLRITRRFEEFLTGNASDDMRYEMIREASVMFFQRPLTGYGMQSFSVLGAFGTYSHNTFWELLASLGVVGTVTFLLPLLGSPLLVRYNRTAALLIVFLLFWSWGAVVFDLKIYWWVLGTLLGSFPARAPAALPVRATAVTAEPT
ncbi:O-antigen ligase family protein [Deinococcus radiotolerans]|uniref:O-antigen ligase-related domain-containing protein n=1 Tax=Deinococcus radiotolerans TaxID=1309407 RepID=A0ABQ2FMN0_9DEIO|nr:O-antigen ligase family protein [Deinococcus radiotolerans]GGL09554.1 hypothetical protein GCM10010844_30310 [Deinococcus radiotolerans]